MNAVDEDGNVIGKVTSVTPDDTGIAFEAELLAEVVETQKRLAARRVDDLILAGASNAAEILKNPALQERTAMEAVQRVMGAGDRTGPAPQAGPARRAKKTATKRQRVKAARKRNR